MKVLVTADNKLKEKFGNEQFEVVKKYCKVYKISPQDLLSLVLGEVTKEIEQARQKDFITKILDNPVAFRVLFIVNTPPEDFQGRLKLYELVDPIADHRYLCLLAQHLRKADWESYLRHLAHDFSVNFIVDYQKLAGRPGTIAELRENYERVSALEDETQKREIDLWPKARVVQFIRTKDKKVEAHFYPLQKQDKTKFNNFIDEFMIGWMQELDNPELRDDAYAFKKEGPAVFIFLYDLNGNLLKAKKAQFPHIPFALKEKYKPLLKSLSEAYPLEETRGKSDWQGSPPPKEEEEVAEYAFFKSILTYTKDKGPPPGYFRLAVLHDLYKEYKKREEEEDRRLSLDSTIESPNGKEYPIIEVLRKDLSVEEDWRATHGDWVLIDEVIRDTYIQDEVDNIILKNYEKSDSKIAKIITNMSGKPITKQAVQKRRANNVEPLLFVAVRDKVAVKEDEERGRKYHVSEPIIQEAEEEK